MNSEQIDRFRNAMKKQFLNVDLVDELCDLALRGLASGEPVAFSLPERDHSKPAARQGLFRKFVVERVDGSDRPGGKHHGCRYFVIDMDHDAHAPAALRAYAIDCKDSHPQLSADLIEHLNQMNGDKRGRI